MRIPGVRWLQFAALLLPLVALAVLWKWSGMREWAHPDRLAELFEPYRSSWFGAPLMLLVFVVAELFMFPILVLIFVCGVVFGPWLGTVLALVGSLASSVLPFWIGRRVGRERLEAFGGDVVRALGRALKKRGVVAVFLVRKIPAPFTLVNMVCGASPIAFRDFLVGTCLGMAMGVALLTILGSRLVEVLRDPSPAQIALSIAVMAVPLIPALLFQRAVNRRLERRLPPTTEVRP